MDRLKAGWAKDNLDWQMISKVPPPPQTNILPSSPTMTQEESEIRSIHGPTGVSFHLFNIF